MYCKHDTLFAECEVCRTAEELKECREALRRLLFSLFGEKWHSDDRVPKWLQFRYGVDIVDACKIIIIAQGENAQTE